MQPILPIRPYRFHYNIHDGVNVSLDPFRVLSDRVLFWIVRDRVPLRVLSERVLYRPSVIGFSLRYSVIGFLFRVLFKVLSNGVRPKVILRVLVKHLIWCPQSSFFSMSCVTSCINNFRALQQFSVLSISISKEMQLPEIWASS